MKSFNLNDANEACGKGYYKTVILIYEVIHSEENINDDAQYFSTHENDDEDKQEDLKMEGIVCIGSGKKGDNVHSDQIGNKSNVMNNKVYTMQEELNTLSKQRRSTHKQEELNTLSKQIISKDKPRKDLGFYI